MTMASLIAVAMGGALGAVARYIISFALGAHGVLIINITGCLALGMLVSALSFKLSTPHPHFILFLTVGVLGGFTTFSAFSLEAMAFLDTHRYMQCAPYVISSVLGGFGAFILGRYLVKIIV